MKLRADFVTNSSSSSFIFCLKKSSEPLEVQLEDLFAEDPEAEEIVKQLKYAKKFFSLDDHLAAHSLDDIDRRIISARKTYARLNSSYDCEEIFEDWRIRAETLEEIWQSARVWGCNVYEVEVGDESGNPVEIAIEHGEYDDYFPCACRLNNH